MARGAPLNPVRRLDLPGLAGCLGLLAFAASAWSPEGLHRALLAFCLAAAVASREARRALWGDPVFRFALVFAGYLAVQAAWGAFLFPETAHRQALDFLRWLSIFGFLPFACLLRGDARCLNAMLVLAVAGLWASLLRRTDWWSVVWFETGGHQTGFGIEPSASGLVSAAALLGLVLFSGRLIDACRRRWWFGLGFPLLAAGIHLSAYRLVASQTRAAWIALVLVLLAALGSRFAGKRRAFLPLLGMSAVVLAILAGGIATNAASILARVGPDKDEFAALLKGDADPSRVSSLGPRFQAQKFGVEKWLERPVMGWGTGSTQPLIRGSQRPELLTRPGGPSVAHLHNFFLEVLVRFGLLGVLVFAWGGWILVRSFRRADPCRRMPEDLFLFLLGAVALAGVVALAGLHVLNEHWRSFWFMAMGGLYSFVLWPGLGPALEERTPVRDSPA